MLGEPAALAALVAAYLVGSVSSATILVRLVKGDDIRKLGSGNAGATNVLRTAGKGLGLATLALDVLKGVAAVFLMGWITWDPRWTGAAAVAVTVGHVFPVFFGFRGGKGVATAMGAFAVLAPLSTLATIGAGLVVIFATRFVSLGSITGACLLPVALKFLGKAPDPHVGAAFVLALLLVVSHRANVRRLVRGEECRLGRREEP